MKANTIALINAASGNVLDNDWQSGGVTLTAILVSGPTHGTLVLNAEGDFTYAPGAGFVGDDSFVYRVGDGANPGGYATVSLHATDAAPVASDADYSVHAGNVLTGGVAARVSDEDDFVGLTITRATGSGYDPLHGTATVAADGSFTYTPAVGFVGEDRFYYRASDGVLTSPAYKVTVSVDNAVAIGGEDAYFVWPGDGIAVGEANVLANDRDSDGDSIHAVLLTGPLFAAPGSFALNADGTFTYERSGSTGAPDTDTFTYAVSDGFSTGAPVTVTISSATTPVGMDDYFFVPESGALTVELSDGVLGNDAKAGGVALTAVLASGIDPAVGTLALNANGSFTFTPGASFVDGAEFTYVPFVNGAALQGDPVRVVLVKAFGALFNAIKGSVALQEVTFNQRQIVRDMGPINGPAGYQGANWLDKNANGVVTDAGDQRTPLTVAAGNHLEVKNVQFQVGAALAGIWASAQKNSTIRVHAQQPGGQGIQFGYGMDNLAATFANGLITLAQATSDNTIGDRVRYDENFQLDWELSFDNGLTWIAPNVGASHTTLYVTRGQAPENLQLVESLLYISTTAVENQDYSEQEFVDAVFKKFEPFEPGDVPAVYRTGGGEANRLHYYGQWRTTNGNWIDLLKTGDGTCVAWADLSRQTLAANGIASTRRIPVSKNQDERILVNNWTFAAVPNLPATFTTDVQEGMRVPNNRDQNGALILTLENGTLRRSEVGDTNGSVPVRAKGVTFGQVNLDYDKARPVTYTHFNLPVAGDSLVAANENGYLTNATINNKHSWLGAPAIVPAVTHDTTGVPGQGQVNPLSVFIDHVLISYGGKVYDPSYGRAYASMAAFESTAIAGFVLERDLNEKQVNVDLNADGQIADKEVRVFLFRKNGTDQDLV